MCGSEGGVFPGVPFLRKDIGATEAGRLQEMGKHTGGRHERATASYTILVTVPASAGVTWQPGAMGVQERQ